MDSDQGKLFIGGISWETTEEKLKDYFGSFGEVTEAVIMKDRSTGRARGFGFVVFSDPTVSDIVVLEKHNIDGRLVRSLLFLLLSSDGNQGGSLQIGSSSAKIVDCILSLKAYQEWQLHGGPRLWKAIGGGSFRTPCPLKHLTKSGSGRHTENHHPSSQQYCQIRESSRKRFPFDETSSPFSGQSVRFGQSRGQSNDEFLDEIGKCSFSLHLISILSLFNRFHLCVFFLFIYLV